jgi:hypothetical protein
MSMFAVGFAASRNGQLSTVPENFEQGETECVSWCLADRREVA